MQGLTFYALAAALTLVQLAASAALACGDFCTTLSDGIGDAVARPTDPDGDGPYDPSLHRLIDLSELSIGSWEPYDAQMDLFAGTFEEGGEFMRMDLVLDGLVNPPGSADPLMFSPFTYGDHPVFGYVEIDMDNDQQTGGELDTPQYRFLGNAVRFGGRPTNAFGDRVATSGSDFDANFLTPPFVERHGEEFHLALQGEQFDAAGIEELYGDGDTIFEAGEIWNIKAPMFHRAHAYEQFSLAVGGSIPGEYAPDCDVQFRHDTTADVTYVSLVFPLAKKGASQMRGEPEQSYNGDPSDHASVHEALKDLHESAEFLAWFPTGLPEEAIITGWEFKKAKDFLNATSWDITVLLGTSYTAPDPSGEFYYVWTDIYPNDVRGDVNGDGLADSQDEQMIQQYISSADGTDGQVDGQVSILGFALDFSVFDVNHDGVVDGCDALLARGGQGDCNSNGMPDGCEVFYGTAPDQNTNGIPDECDACLTDAHCDDVNVCTDDICNAGNCVHMYNAAPCDDGLFCTATDTCSNGACVGSGAPCLPGELCNEAGDACELCAADSQCDDGNPCNGVETCDQFGMCQPGSCGMARVVVLQEDFDHGPGGFSYRDDAFRGTAEPRHAKGRYQAHGGGLAGGGVRVELGGHYDRHMSGGWAANFTISGSPTSVEIEVACRLVMDGGYEPDEYGEALCSVDGELCGLFPHDYLVRLFGDGDRPSAMMESGWRTHVLSLPLSDGDHELVVGGYNNKSSNATETSEVVFNYVKITSIFANGCGCDDGLFCTGTESCDAQSGCVSSGDPCLAGTWCDEINDACVPFGDGDFDADGDVDLSDFAAFEACFERPAGGGCEPGNFSGDELIDGADLAMFLATLTGPM